MKIPLLALIFQGIPEMIAIITLAYVIANIPLVWRKIIPIAILLAFASYILRLFPITFGIHTVIIIGLLFFILIFFAKSNINFALISSIVSLLAIIIAETGCLSILMPLFGVTPEVFFTNTKVRILLTWPQVLVIFLLAFAVIKIRARRERQKTQKSNIIKVDNINRDTDNKV